MQQVQLAYNFNPSKAQQGGLSNPMIAMLQTVAQHGSILAASKALGLSYRHVWGELKRWEKELGQPLLVWERGQAAQLTAFAQRLIYAEAQALARLAPQIEALQAELERGLALAFDPSAHVIALHASHDEALSRLRVHAAKSKLHLDVNFTGSLDALRALNDGRCLVAGFHTRLPAQADSLASRTYKPLLIPGQHKILGFVQRSQGLIVAKGNPLKIKSLADVAKRGLRFVNRPAGTGTRVLLDELLAEQGIAKSAITGYKKSEPSHQAAALAVAQGIADVALGIEAAAQGQAFVPLVQERYALVCHAQALDDPAVQLLAKQLKSAAWLKELSAMVGYLPLQSGKVLKMTETLPWWDF
ncbi:substrate-binding domain-containing protein [Variovorax sp. PCZ-1]|uniref:helix-turn-helix transcriptional regulator n=1 Tax=Variovorax sp. PCZ-1 TaxID=2835533 RepID=UPI001BCF445C|nr:substrate-binding domain-containing protein [Variovorax sp. PCZ-1]MBS7806565.1 helix-turn-helix transcriptional regulator [Variovorax sp. PCZ-1]